MDNRLANRIALPHRVHPDISCYRIQAIVWPQDMIVERALPQRFSEPRFEFITGPLLKEFDESYEIAALMGAFDQKMHVVRHDAPRMKNKMHV